MSIKKSKIKYIVGEIYTFTVKAILYDFCELRDEDNFAVYLQHTDKLRLVKGQKISCKVLANNEKRPKIELVQIEDTTEQEVLDANVVDEIIKPIATTWNTRVFSKLLMMREKDRSFEDECRSWIGLLNNAGCDLRQVRNDCTYFLEQTSFLSLCNAAEREFYQERLTMMIEFLGYYIKANQLLEEGEENTFIDNIFDKLTSSGFVYHPAKNFNIMSCLFLADRKLMEERMEKLFDIIRLWKTEVWGKEPFNSTLIKIIDLYVSENIWTVDRIKDNASLIANLIQALTIQLILLKQTDKDNETEYRLCLARLCLISSYLYNYNSSPKQTLGLALSNLLNVSCQVPLYTLQETKQKTVPYKICGMSPKPIDTTSCFIHGKGKLMISKSGIALYATQNEGEKPMMPSELNLWGQLQVLADKRSVRALPSKPSIMDCKNLWEDIEQDMFATKATPMVKVDSRKSHKVDEKVDIIITPLCTIATGAAAGTLLGPWVSAFMSWLGGIVNWGTEQQPLLMGIIVSVLMGIFLTLPISSAAIGVALGLSGITAGAATIGCCCNMIGFAVISYRENKMDGLLAQGLGTSMLQMPNIIKNPRIWIPSIISSAILGPISTMVFGMTSNAVGSGMGTAGLVGPISTFTTMVETTNPWIVAGEIVLMYFILPAAISLGISEFMRKKGWIKSGDMKLDI